MPAKPVFFFKWMSPDLLIRPHMTSPSIIISWLETASWKSYQDFSLNLIQLAYCAIVTPLQHGFFGSFPIANNRLCATRNAICVQIENVCCQFFTGILWLFPLFLCMKGNINYDANCQAIFFRKWLHKN